MIKIPPPPFHERDIFSVIEKMSFGYTDVNKIHPIDNDVSLAIPNSVREPFSLNEHNQNYQPSFVVDKIRDDFPILKRTVHKKPLIWLDNAATTQKPQSVIDAITKYYECENSNIHRGAHTLSIEATEKYEETRKKVAQFINASSESEIVFIRGATEGINLVANTFGKKYIEKGDEIIITMLEHHSNLLPWQKLCDEKGAVLRVIPIHENGELIMDQYINLLNSRTKLVAFAHVSNAIGTVLPVNLMTKLAHQQGAYVLVDGAQAVPHFPVDVQAIDCDFYVFSGHKLFGPTGIGVLYGKNPILHDIPPWHVGGGMIDKVTIEKSEYVQAPFKFEAGTGSIAEVFGLNAVLDYLDYVGMSRIETYEKKLMSYTLEKLNTVPNLKIIGNPSYRVGSIPFIIEGVETLKIGTYLDQYGIALRTGHHCAQPALAFYGLNNTARASLAFYNTHDEIDIFVSTLNKLAHER